MTVAARACASTDPTLERTALRYLVEVVGVGLDDTLDSWDAGLGSGVTTPQSKVSDTSEMGAAPGVTPKLLSVRD